MYEAIIKPKLTNASLVWGKTILDEKTGGAGEYEGASAKRSSWGGQINTNRCPRGTLRIGRSQNSISVQAVKANYRMQNARGVKFVNGTEQRKLSCEGVPGMPSDRTFSELLIREV